MGGDLRARSQHGVGSSFTLTLPGVKHVLEPSPVTAGQAT